jgi:hypothetical protein
MGLGVMEKIESKDAAFLSIGLIAGSSVSVKIV